MNALADQAGPHGIACSADVWDLMSKSTKPFLQYKCHQMSTILISWDAPRHPVRIAAGITLDSRKLRGSAMRTSFAEAWEWPAFPAFTSQSCAKIKGVQRTCLAHSCHSCHTCSPRTLQSSDLFLGVYSANCRNSIFELHPVQSRVVTPNRIQRLWFSHKLIATVKYTEGNQNSASQQAHVCLSTFHSSPEKKHPQPKANMFLTCFSPHVLASAPNFGGTAAGCRRGPPPHSTDSTFVTLMDCKVFVQACLQFLLFESFCSPFQLLSFDPKN